LHLAVETPHGLFASLEFCQASALVDAVIFGAGDFVAASGFSDDEDCLIYPRSHLSLVASSLGIDALDMVFTNLADVEGLALSAARGRALGYAGKWVIHPGQVDVVNGTFGPTAEELSQAQRILTTLSDAERRGQGAATLDGSLIDEASMRWAESIVARTSVVGH
jgi:citrate lyase subunit beta/citryl-CoA lyase